MAGDANFRLIANSNYDAIDIRIKQVYQERSEPNSSMPFIDWDSVKWHSMKADVLKISKEFPKDLICIEKHMNDTSLFNDDEDTFSRHYFKNGKYKYCKSKVVYEPFNEKDLK